MAKKERTAEEAAAKAARKAARASLKSKTEKVKSKGEGKKKEIERQLDSSLTPALSLDEKLAKYSPLLHITTSLYLALSPCAYHDPVEGLCAEHLSPYLLAYFPPLHGVLLSFSNARISESPDHVTPKASSSSVLAQSFNEYAVSFVWLTCDFVIFRPSPGMYLEGEVNLQSEGLLGLICYNYFNVSIPKEYLPANWTWTGQTWQDSDGKLDRKVVFKVRDFETSGQESISITGTLVGL